MNPVELNLSTLPSVPLRSRAQLPSAAGIYLAIDLAGVVQYIGRSSNIRRRWANHHRENQLHSMLGVRLSWIEVTDLALLPSIENALISWFAPPLNRSLVERRLNRPTRSSFYGEKKKNHSFMLTPTASEGVEELAEKCRLTRSELIERVIRELKTGKYSQLLDAIKVEED